jgi:hypothetical protein
MEWWNIGVMRCYRFLVRKTSGVCPHIVVPFPDAREEDGSPGPVAETLISRLWTCSFGVFALRARIGSVWLPKLSFRRWEAHPDEYFENLE